MNCDVLLTYSWNRVGYSILRNLTDFGLSVVVADASKYNICSFSNRKCASAVYADPFTQAEKFIEDLNAIILKYKPRVLLPTHEETFLIAKYRKKITSDISIPIAEFEDLLKAHNKITAAQVARNAGVPVPDTFLLHDKNEIDTLKNKISYPAVLKLPKSNAAKGVFYAKNEEELKMLVDRYYNPGNTAENNLFLQEYVGGTGYGASFLYDNGKMITGFVHRRLIEKTHTGGVSTRRQSVKNTLLLEYGKCILDSMNWHGVAMVEFKYDEIAQKAWFIEINPRYWGSLALPITAGLPLPYWHYCIAVGNKFDLCDYKEGVVSKWILGDMIALIERVVSRKLTWKEFKSFLQFNADNYDDFKKDDPKAFLGEIFYYVSKLIKSGKLNPDSNQTVEF